MPRQRRTHRLQILITQRCNAICLHCDKAVGLANMPDMEMTTKQMRQYVDQILAEKFPTGRLSITGGEPIVSRHLQGILYEVARLPVPKIRVYTNDLNSTREKREAIELPDDRFVWNPSPLDDLDNPLSGKNKKKDADGKAIRYRQRTHTPFWISPADIGIESKWEYCTVKDFCGKGLDGMGFSMCGQAPIIGRVLGINPYPKEGTILEKVLKPVEEICKHCIYGMDMGKGDKKKLLLSYGIEQSDTFARAFEGKPVLQIGTEKVR